MEKSGLVITFLILMLVIKFEFEEDVILFFNSKINLDFTYTERSTTNRYKS